MEKSRYQKLVKKYKPNENRLFNGMMAFLVGGIMGIIGQFLVEFITLIFIGCLLTCFKFFDKWVHFAKAGLFVPITGFAHAMMSAALDYKKEGMVTGLGASMFKLTGSVIIFGVVSAYVFGLIRILLFGGTI